MINRDEYINLNGLNSVEHLIEHQLNKSSVTPYVNSVLTVKMETTLFLRDEDTVAGYKVLHSIFIAQK